MNELEKQMKTEFFTLIALILAVIPVGIVAGWPLNALVPGVGLAVIGLCIVVLIEHFKDKK